MDPFTGALILGGIGAGTGYLQAKQQERQNQANMLAQAAAARYSPWTGIKPQMGGASSPDVGASTFGGAAQGALGGYMQMKNIEQTDAANENMKKLIEAQAAKKQTFQNPQSSGLASASLWERMNRGS